MARQRTDQDREGSALYADYLRFTNFVRHGSSALDKSMEQDEDISVGISAKDANERLDAVKDAVEQHRDVLERQREEKTYVSIHQWVKRRGTKLAKFAYRFFAVLLCLAIIYILLSVTTLLPAFGHVGNPTDNEVSQRYIESGMKETGAVNIVAGMILDYRAFDTLGESNVLFTAACTVLILLRISQDESDVSAQLEQEADDRMYEPRNDTILQKNSTVLVPFVLLFGIYMLLNGHISPGGGFSGGAVMGAGLILYLTAFGFKKAERFFTFRTFKIISVTALSFYAVSKAYSFFTGANHLSSFITPGTPGKIFSAGLIPYLDIAVGMVVCCTMYGFYTLFRKGDM